ncbi:copper transporter [Mumia sp. zg.B17]|uniref:copper transporter n=1 Tax=Mumia sp. zg.B17 TaxID=2855446 RepID=UPI001C6E49C1|nr:copper transporter [Mumia sp. zg.B17]MBW9204937.1 copper transporter [Mumia sp. zg.B17]
MPVRSLLVVAAALLLALAGGIALGTGVLDGAEAPPAAAETSRSAEDTPEDVAARGLAEAYRDQLGAAPLAGRLTGRSVVMVTLPGAADSTVDSVDAALKAAGATVVGSVAVTDRMLDPADRQFAVGVAQQTLKGVTDTPTDGLANYEVVGAALGRGLAAKATTAVDAPAQTIVSALTEAKLVGTAQAPASRAQLALVVAGTDETFESGRGELLATMVSGMDSAGLGSLVVGPVGSGAPDGAVEAVRASPSAESVSTVDVVGVPFGDVALVTALQQESSGKAGHFGTSGAADGDLPTPG